MALAGLWLYGHICRWRRLFGAGHAGDGRGNVDRVRIRPAPRVISDIAVSAIKRRQWWRSGAQRADALSNSKATGRRSASPDDLAVAPGHRRAMPAGRYR